MSATMRAVDIKGGKGDANSLFISSSIPKPTVGPGQAIVKIQAFGLNRMDLIQREGNYPVPAGASKVLGVEFSGTITELAAESCKDGFKVGDAVFGLAYGGAYAEFIAVNTHMLLHKPEHISWTDAAGIPETWITATQALHLVGEFSKGKSVLWHAGASSVSIAGIQLALTAGASAVYVTAGSQEKIDFCVKELGATAGFNYHTQDWSKEILKATDNKGVDIIIDFVGPNYFQGNINAAAMDGHIVFLGFLSGTQLPNGVNMGPIILKRLRLEGSTLRARDPEYQGRLRDFLEKYIDKFEDGSFKHFVEKVFPWEEITDAHLLMESNKTKGKIICTVN